MKHSLLNFLFLKVCTISIFSMGTFKRDLLTFIRSRKMGKIPKGWIYTVLITSFLMLNIVTTVKSHCVESVQIRSFFWSVLFCIRTEYRKIRTRKIFLYLRGRAKRENEFHPLRFRYDIFVCCLHPYTKQNNKIFVETFKCADAL